MSILYRYAIYVICMQVSMLYTGIYVCYNIIYVGIYSVIGLVHVSGMSPSHIQDRLALASFLHVSGGILSGSIAVGLFSLDSKHAYSLGRRLVIQYTCVVKHGVLLGWFIV